MNKINYKPNIGKQSCQHFKELVNTDFTFYSNSFIKVKLMMVYTISQTGIAHHDYLALAMRVIPFQAPWFPISTLIFCIIFVVVYY